MNDTIKSNLLTQLELYEHEEDEANDILNRIACECNNKGITEILENGGDSTTFSAEKVKSVFGICPHWIVLGDTVCTPYGKGNIIHVSRVARSPVLKLTIQLDFGTAYIFDGGIETVEKEPTIKRWEALLSCSDIAACNVGAIDLRHKFSDGYNDVSADLHYPSTELPHSIVTSSSTSSVSVSSSDDNEHLNMDVDCNNPEDVIKDCVDYINPTRILRLLPFGNSRLPAQHSRESTV